MKRFVRESGGTVVVEYLPAYAPELNPDEQVWNHAKARLARLFVTSKEQMRAEMNRILKSIQRSRDLVLSSFQLDTTQYSAGAT